MRGRALWISTILAVSAPAGAGVKIDQWIAQSGARVNFVESHALPIVDVAVEFAAGSAYDSREQAGLARATLAPLQAGAGPFSGNPARPPPPRAGAPARVKIAPRCARGSAAGAPLPGGRERAGPRL